MANATTTSSNLAKNSLRVKQPEELLARPAAVTTSTTSSRSSSTSSSECGVHVAEVDTFPSTVPPCITTAFPTSNTGGCVMCRFTISYILWDKMKKIPDCNFGKLHHLPQFITIFFYFCPLIKKGH